MSREIKRVPLDFEWPLNKVWDGFVNPHFKRCPAEGCHAGQTAAAQWVEGLARLIAMLGEEAVEAPHAEELRRCGRLFPHPYLEDWAHAPRDREPKELMDRLDAAKDDAARSWIYKAYWNRYRPKLVPLTEELAGFVTGIAGRRPNPPLGGNIEFDIYRALLKAAKIKDKNWGVCSHCGGDGIDPAARAAYESWEPTEPPAGPGWQLWETVTEGSPVSAVFATRQEFVSYLVDQGHSKKAAEEFCKRGRAPSGVMTGGQMYDGIEACGLEEDGGG